MRLEVTCQDRIGLTRELLDLLVLRNIDLKGIEISPARRIYLNFTQIDFNIFRGLMAEIRRINGVIDVRTVAFMPSEKEHRAMWTLLESVPEPIFSIDMKGNIELANSAALALFGFSKERINQKNIGHLISNYPFLHWLESEHHQPHSTQLSIKGQDYGMDIIPMQLMNENQTIRCVGAVIMLRSGGEQRSVVHIGSSPKPLIVNDGSAFEHIIAVSPKMVHVVEQARKMAMLDAPLLLIGETGTGKDEFAKACHLRSARGTQPFLGLNCASMPDDVVESELFGYAAGAYPNALEGKKGFFEQANGGTVLLDEIGEMSPQMQIKLLRFLNDGTFRRVGEENEVKVNVRIICATQKNLIELVQKGAFREDLYYRLNVLTITIPPLRERQADIMPLTDYFVTRFAQEQGLPKPKFSADLASFLCGYHWPGNVRQLRNAIYQALTQLEGNKLSPQDIQLPERETEVAFNEDILVGSLDDISKRFERSVLTRLYRHYPSTRKLAKRLGVSHTAIANKLREYGLSGKKPAVEHEDDE
ncbi:transcriptional regulator TyrR [Xenorhabdus sp. IM139775]|uniref:transcriptional regulator TyrR n=1 Tax=Xenorhabdus sp. IM139775 TaxID=3025876 RepID=UPI0023589359|nr:transcriptional regulator TyrR [Xenorhabdus sp. IM139775]MDC9592064.1 transcriptional regulator TyrR [Xenorhabdus sp. IM139775]